MRAHYESRLQLLDQIKLERGCADCGYNEHPAALQFHHRDPSEKVAGVGRLANASLERLLNEVAKCEVLCANCHSIRHYSKQ